MINSYWQSLKFQAHREISAISASCLDTFYLCVYFISDALIEVVVQNQAS